MSVESPRISHKTFGADSGISLSISCNSGLLHMWDCKDAKRTKTALSSLIPTLTRPSMPADDSLCRPNQSLRTSPLEECPPEICKKIFTHACDDGGYTGRSLSLVSRYVRDVSEDIKFRSVAVWGRRQILGFYQVLLSTPPHLRRILHLFISAHEQVRPGEVGPAENYQWSTDSRFVRVESSFIFFFCLTE